MWSVTHDCRYGEKIERVREGGERGGKGLEGREGKRDKGRKGEGRKDRGGRERRYSSGQQKRKHSETINGSLVTMMEPHTNIL